MIDKIISMADVTSADTDFIFSEIAYYQLHKYNNKHIKLKFVF